LHFIWRPQVFILYTLYGDPRSRCNSERFREFISTADDGGESGATEELAEVKEVLFQHRDMIYGVFAHYASSWGADTANADLSNLDKGAFFHMMHEFHIIGITGDLEVSELDNLFEMSNFEDSSNLDNNLVNSINEDDACTRYEFLRLVVMVGAAKYKKGSRDHIDDVSEAVESLLEDYFVRGCQLVPEARHDSDIFRRARLYKRETDLVLSRHAVNLERIFVTFCSNRKHIRSGSEDSELPADEPEREALLAAAMMGYAEWEFLLECAGVLNPLVDDIFGPREAQLCFKWSQPLVTDEIRRNEKCRHLNYIDFLEALCRLCTLKPLPTKSVVEAYGASSASALFKAIDRGEHEASVLYAARIDWQVQEKSAASLEEPFEMLMALFMHHLDTSGEGDLSMKELVQSKAKYRRKIRRGGSSKVTGEWSKAD